METTIPHVIRQKAWTEDELKQLGYAKYNRKKQLVMARRLPEAEAPMMFHWPNETFSVPAGYVICYAPGAVVQAKLSDYDHWPVRPDVFKRTYRIWDVAAWKPSLPEQKLLSLGCKPVYNAAAVWARRLTVPQYVQSVESAQPVLVKSGNWVLVGSIGEVWYQDDVNFRSRYDVK
jgi:hypothetical protein